MKIALTFVAFNNNRFVNALLTSFINTNPDIKDVVIFNNGTEDVIVMPLLEKHLNITILDNRSNQYIDFPKFFAENPPRFNDHWHNNYGSLYHAKALDYLIQTLEYDKLILCDVDVMFTKSLKELFTDDVVCGEIGINPVMNGATENRLLPFLFILDKQVKSKLTYFDKTRFLLLSHPRYDTGASFLEDVLNLNVSFKQIKINDFITHFNGGTWYGKDKNYLHWFAKHSHLLRLPKDESDI